MEYSTKIIGILLFLTITIVNFQKVSTQSEQLYLSNLNDSCLRCICEGFKCNLTRGCNKGYCGPFRISKIYWADAGKVVLPYDDPIRNEAYKDCAFEYNCAKKIIINYMAKYAKDCNGDGVVDCMDYSMMHVNGGPGCSNPPLEETDYGLKFLRNYVKCKIE